MPLAGAADETLTPCSVMTATPRLCLMTVGHQSDYPLNQASVSRVCEALLHSLTSIFKDMSDFFDISAADHFNNMINCIIRVKVNSMVIKALNVAQTDGNKEIQNETLTG